MLKIFVETFGFLSDPIYYAFSVFNTHVKNFIKIVQGIENCLCRKVKRQSEYIRLCLLHFEGCVQQVGLGNVSRKYMYMYVLWSISVYVWNGME